MSVVRPPSRAARRVTYWFGAATVRSRPDSCALCASSVRSRALARAIASEKRDAVTGFSR